MYRKFSLTLITFFTLFCSTSAFDNRISGARSAALGNATVADSHPESLFINTAGSAFLHRVTALVAYESKYAVKEYSLMSAGVLIPARQTGNWGFSVYQFGTGVYREYKLGLMYARTFGPKWAAGLKFNRMSVMFPENVSQAKTFAIEGGLIYRSSERLHLGVHLFNLLNSQYDMPGGKIPLPWSFRIGESWYISDGLRWSVEFWKVRNHPSSLKSGLEFMPQPGFYLRSGFSGRPFYPCFGMGVIVSRIVVDMSFHYHENLGYSPVVSLNYSL